MTDESGAGVAAHGEKRGHNSKGGGFALDSALDDTSVGLPRCVCLSACMSVYHINKCGCVYVCMYVCVYVCVCVCVSIDIDTCIYMWIYLHTYIHRYTYIIHTHIKQVAPTLHLADMEQSHKTTREPDDQTVTRATHDRSVRQHVRVCMCICIDICMYICIYT